MAQKKRDAGGFAAIASIVNYKLQDGTRRQSLELDHRFDLEEVGSSMNGKANP